MGSLATAPHPIHMWPSHMSEHLHLRPCRVSHIYTGRPTWHIWSHYPSAAQFPPGDVVLYTTAGGLPLETSQKTPRPCGAILFSAVCTVAFRGRFDLKTLPGHLKFLGAFEIKGPRRQRRAPSADRSCRNAPEHVNLPVPVKSYPDRTRFSVHHWVGRVWEADHMTAPPLLSHPAPETCLA